MDDMAKRKYSIGQVLYLIPANKNVIIPLLVIEEISKKTMKGEETSFLVQFSADPESTALLSEMQGEVFDSLKEIQKELLSRAGRAVEKLITTAQKAASEWYKLSDASKIIVAEQANENATSHANSMHLEEDGVTVLMPDGTKARYKTTQ
jgi:hypothetical protein